MSASAPKWERSVEALLGVVASVILLAMMALTVVDVVARYIFSRPVRGAFELIVAAFAKGDKSQLRPLLSDDTYTPFAAAIGLVLWLRH